MFKISLNLRKPYNYAFFCPVSKLHLTVSNPVGFAREVTPAILKGLKSQTLLDVDRVIDLSTGKLIETEQPKDNLPHNEPKTPASEPEPDSMINDTGKKKRGRKAISKPSEQGSDEASNALFEGI